MLYNCMHPNTVGGVRGGSWLCKHSCWWRLLKVSHLPPQAITTEHLNIGSLHELCRLCLDACNCITYLIYNIQYTMPNLTYPYLN